MITLAIETSGRAGSVALRREGRLLGEVDLAATGRRHARTLIPEIADLLRHHQLLPAQVNLMAVSLGPGSFTGLRVGIVCAKTMAYAIGCPIVGIDTFLAVAAAQQNENRIWVIEDALRGDVCAGEYQLIDHQWQSVLAPQLLAFEDWRQQLPENAFVTGPGLSQWSDSLTSFRLGTEALRSPHARLVAELGERAFTTGRVDDPWSLEPFYMRRSAAEEKADATGATAR